MPGKLGEAYVQIFKHMSGNASLLKTFPKQDKEVVDNFDTIYYILNRDSLAIIGRSEDSIQNIYAFYVRDQSSRLYRLMQINAAKGNPIYALEPT